MKIDLTRDEWQEIYYALETKLTRDYVGPLWKKELQAIQEKIAETVNV